MKERGRERKRERQRKILKVRKGDRECEISRLCKSFTDLSLKITDCRDREIGCYKDR